MSCCYITTVDGGSRRLFLPNLLRTMVIVMVMMMMARSTSGDVYIQSITPEFEVGSSARILITCKVIGDLNFVIVLKILRNETEVLILDYDKDTKVFQKGLAKPGFGCKIPAVNGWNGEYQCWKNNPNCEDATYFQCATNMSKSPPKSVKMKSFMKDLTSDTENHKINQISTFRCNLYFVPNSEEHVLFKWSVIHGSKETEISQKSVLVPKTNNCYVSLESQFDYNVTIEDYPDIAITCSVLKMELDFVVYIKDKSESSRGTIAGINLGVIAFNVLVFFLFSSLLFTS